MNRRELFKAIGAGAASHSTARAEQDGTRGASSAAKHSVSGAGIERMQRMLNSYLRRGCGRNAVDLVRCVSFSGGACSARVSFAVVDGMQWIW